MKALKAYNTETLNRFHKRKVHSTDVVEELQDDPPEPSVPDSGLSELPESDLDIPEDPLLNMVNRQCHNSEDLNQGLQAYQGGFYIFTLLKMTFHLDHYWYIQRVTHQTKRPLQPSSGPEMMIIHLDPTYAYF